MTAAFLVSRRGSYHRTLRRGSLGEAARIAAALVRKKPRAVLGLATGSTPLHFYGELAGMHSRGLLDFARVTTFNLDEYVGLAPDHPQSYARFMREHFFSKVNMRPIASTFQMVSPRTSQRIARHTRKRSGRRAGSTSSFWASVQTGTSGSTSQVLRWDRGLA